MKTNLPSHFFSSLLTWTMCFILILTTSGCATNIPINPSETTDADSHVSVSKGDHVLVYTKDNRTLDMAVTEVDSEKQIIRGPTFHMRDYSWGSSPVYDSSLDVNFSEIVSIEIKEPNYNSSNSNDDLTVGKFFKVLLVFTLCPIGCGLN